MSRLAETLMPEIYGTLPQTKPETAFDGETYRASQDYARLTDQAKRVFNLMCDGEWRTLAQIAEATNAPQPSVSSRLRDFRKLKCGGHAVNRKHLGDGLYAYQLIPALVIKG